MGSQWHVRQRCGSIRNAVMRTVESSSGVGKYSVYVNVPRNSRDCTCPGFRFHGKCKHVAAVEQSLCQWSSDSPVDQTLQQNVNCVCPACGGETDLEKDEAA